MSASRSTPAGDARWARLVQERRAGYLVVCIAAEGDPYRDPEPWTTLRMRDREQGRREAKRLQTADPTRACSVVRATRCGILSWLTRLERRREAEPDSHT